jgi:hypothetical protein
MENTNLRIEGIYDSRTFQFLRAQGVGHFSFDLRPRSSNFIQIQKVVEMLEHALPLGIDGSQQNMQAPCSFYLHFENEKDFVVHHILNEIQNVVGKAAMENLYLEFSDTEGAQYYSQFQRPFFWHYNERANFFQDIVHSPLLAGVCVGPLGLSKKFGIESLLSIWHNLNVSLVGNPGGQKTIVVQSEWTDEVAAFLLEQQHFNISDGAVFSKRHKVLQSLLIDSQVEVCYRNVDLGRLRGHLENFMKCAKKSPGLVPNPSRA